MRARMVAAALLLVLAACGGDDDAAPEPTTTIAPDAPESATCLGAAGFEETTSAWARDQGSIDTTFELRNFTLSDADPTWARGTLDPADESLDALTIVAHCVRGTWAIADAGTSGVGCGSGVPEPVQADLGVDCDA